MFVFSVVESNRVNICVGNGWKELDHKYDCIHVGAAADGVPHVLVEAMKEGGTFIYLFNILIYL